MNLRKNTHRRLLAFLLGTLSLTILSLTRGAWAQCSGCSVSVSGSTNVNDPGNNSVVCITGPGTYTGTINMNNRNQVDICVATGVTFSGTIQNWKNNFVIKNYGTWTSPFNWNSDVSFQNHGAVNIAGSWNITGGSFSGDGTVNVGGSLQINSGNIDLGPTTVGGAVSVAGGTLTLGNPSTISGALTVNAGNTLKLDGSLTVGGAMNNMGTITTSSAATGCTSIYTGSTFSNTGTITGAGGNTIVLNQNPGGTQSNTQVATPPTAQPGTLTITNPTPNNFSGSFAAASPAPGGYVVLRRRNSTIGTGNYPAFGSTVTVGSYVKGSKVIAVLAPASRTFTDAPDSCGTYYYTAVSMSNATGTCATYATGASASAGSVTGNPNASAIVYGSTSYCQAQPLTSVTRTGQSGGTYSFSPAGLAMNTTTGAINPSASSVNTYTITYSVAAGTNGCAATSSSNTSVQVVATPTANITYPAASFCQGAGVAGVTQTGISGTGYTSSPAGLTLDATTGAITPSTSSVNSYTVSYNIAATTSCPARSYTRAVAIAATPSASISYPAASYCMSATAKTVVFSGTTGGTYSVSPSGLNLNTGNGTITPTGSPANTYTVTYTMAATAGCPQQTTNTTVAITTTPVNSIGYSAASFCTAATSVPVSLSGGAGGTYSASPAGLTINGSTGAINPSTSTQTSYTVTYAAPASTTCPIANATAIVAVAPTPTAAINYAAASFCIGASAKTVSQSGAAGGTYSASPAGLTINASDGSITPSSSSANSYTVSYDIAATPSCPARSYTTSLAITATPSASIAYPSASYCRSAGAISVNQSGTGGGSYSSIPGSLSLNSGSGAITPSSSPANNYTVTYTIPATAGCPAQTTNTAIDIITTPTNAIAFDRNTYCSTAASGTLTLTGTLGGTYSSTPGGLTINASTGAITPSTSTPNSYTVTYAAPASTTCPIANATTNVTITNASAPFVWQGGSSSMMNPSNWNPHRGSVNPCDVLQVSSGGNITVNSVSSQTIRKIQISNNTNLTLSAPGNANINLTGDGGVALEVEEGSSLTINGNQLTITAQAGTQVVLNGTLTMTAGTLNLSGATLIMASSSGSFVPLAATSGKITTSSSTDIVFGSTGKTSMASFTIPNGIFTTSPAAIGDLTIQTSHNPIALGNQDMRVYGSFARPSGATVLRLNGRTLSLYGSTSGTPTIQDNTATSTLGLHGNGDLSNLRFSTPSLYLHNLVVNRTWSNRITFPAVSDLTIGGSVSFTKGILSTGSNKIILNTTANLSNENDSSYIMGTLQQTRTLAQGVLYTFSGMRCTIQANGNAPGVATVTRINDAPVFLGIGYSVGLRYVIDPAVDVNLNASLTVKLLNCERNGKPAADLVLCRLPQGGTLWEEQVLTEVNASTLSYSQHNIPSFSTWSLGVPMEILPVRLAFFRGQATPQGHAQLTWETLSEKDNAGFAIFRLREGGGFDSIAFVRPQAPTDGRRRYTFTDRNAGPSNVYRLRQYDFSGRAETFPLVYVSTGKAPEMGYVSVFPNPFTDDRFSLLNKSRDAKACTLTLRSSSGAVVFTGKAELGPSSMSTIDLPRLGAGAYILEVLDGATARHFLRVVKQ